MKVITDEERMLVAKAAKAMQLAPDGPTMERFDATGMARILEQEAERAILLGYVSRTPGKVEIFMDPRDALELAKFLRRHGGS